MLKKLTLNAFQIKVIALIIMTIDHLAFYQTFTNNTNINYILRIIGRIAAPLFLFLITEGLHHTRSKPKYIFRLYTASALTEFINMLFLKYIAIGYSASSLGNIFSTFFYVAFYVYVIELLINHKSCKTTLLATLALLIPVLGSEISKIFPNTQLSNILHIFCPSLFTVNYSILFIVLGITWYFINNQNINCIVLAILACLSLLISDTASMINWLNIQTLFINPQWCMFLSIPFILLYNGEKGKATKYFFYFYYPLHQYYLFLIFLITR